MAKNPDLDYVTSVFKEVIGQFYFQCININVEKKIILMPIIDITSDSKTLCPTCIQECLCLESLPLEEIGSIEPKAMVNKFSVVAIFNSL